MFRRMWDFGGLAEAPMALDCRRELEYLEEAHASTGKMCKPHTERLQANVRLKPASRIITVN